MCCRLTAQERNVMSKYEDLRKDMIAAMKAHDKQKKEVVSSLVSAVKKLAIDEGQRDDITDEIADKAIMKELKSAKESLDTCPDSRADLKAEYQYRYDVIASYAPKMMSADEIEKTLRENFADALATKNVGKIMKAVMPQLKGKADGKDIKAVVTKLIKE